MSWRKLQFITWTSGLLPCSAGLLRKVCALIRPKLQQQLMGPIWSSDVSDGANTCGDAWLFWNGRPSTDRRASYQTWRQFDSNCAMSMIMIFFTPFLYTILQQKSFYRLVITLVTHMQIAKIDESEQKSDVDSVIILRDDYYNKLDHYNINTLYKSVFVHITVSSNSYSNMLP